MNNNIFIQCPHCKQYMELIKKEINCAIYRHGVYKKTNKQIDPHSSKQICDELIKNDLIYGCGKPFKLITIKDNDNISYQVQKCDYI